MITEEEKLALENIGDGAASELFDIALQDVLKDIEDPNKKQDAVRSIVLKFNFKPADTPGIVAYNIECPDAKLAPRKAMLGAMMVGRGSDGRMVAHALVRHEQRTLPIDTDKVHDINQKREEASDAD